MTDGLDAWAAAEACSLAGRFSARALAAAFVGGIDIEAVAVSSVSAGASLLAGAAVGAVPFRSN